jgi:hypothetical protein
MSEIFQQPTIPRRIDKFLQISIPPAGRGKSYTLVEQPLQT